MNKLTEKVKNIDTKTLKEVASLLMDNFSDGSGLTFDAVISELENRMPEEEYVAFCDTL